MPQLRNKKIQFFQFKKLNLTPINERNEYSFNCVCIYIYIDGKSVCYFLCRGNTTVGKKLHAMVSQQKPDKNNKKHHKV